MKEGRGKIIRYSEAFKLHVIEDMDKNGLTQAEVVKKYGLSHHSVLHEWLAKYAKHLLHRIVRIQMPKEKNPYDEIKELKKEKQKLESALAQSHLKNLVLESMIEVAEEEFQIPIKKNFGKKQLKELKQKTLKSQ
jgi:transposase